MIQTTSIILDNVLDETSIDKINIALGQSSCKSTWYDLTDNHIYDNFCVSLINLAGRYPLCSIVYYSCVKSLLGGRLYVEDDIITPKTNRMIIFAAGARHYVEDFSGHRVSMLINPWDRYVSVN